jgi:hypothetical protein
LTWARTWRHRDAFFCLLASQINNYFSDPLLLVCWFDDIVLRRQNLRETFASESSMKTSDCYQIPPSAGRSIFRFFLSFCHYADSSKCSTIYMSSVFMWTLPEYRHQHPKLPKCLLLEILWLLQPRRWKTFLRDWKFSPIVTSKFPVSSKAWLSLVRGFE